MSFAYLPLFTGDYLRDTRHLSTSKHGIYLLLLMHCWDQKGPVPLDEQEAAGIANCRSQDEIEALRYVISRFFVRMDDGFYNPRMQREIERSESISAARSDAGKKGYIARSKHLPSKSQAIAKQVHLSPSPSPTLSPVQEKKKRVEARATRLALDSCPDSWVSFCKKERKDLEPVETFDRFCDYWKSVPGARGRKLDWERTWRNWVRNERQVRKAGSSDRELNDLIAKLEAQ